MHRPWSIASIVHPRSASLSNSYSCRSPVAHGRARSCQAGARGLAGGDVADERRAVAIVRPTGGRSMAIAGIATYGMSSSATSCLRLDCVIASTDRWELDGILVKTMRRWGVRNWTRCRGHLFVIKFSVPHASLPHCPIDMYVELHTSSAFSFLDGASLPESLIQRAAELGYPTLALLDRDGVYGAPQFYRAAKAAESRRSSERS